MAISKKEQQAVLSVYFTEESFVIEQALYEDNTPQALWSRSFTQDKYKALYHLGFLREEGWFSPGVVFLHRIAELLIRKLCSQPDIEFSRELAEAILEEDEAIPLIEEVPFVLGMELVDEPWIRSLWERLLAVYKEEVLIYDGEIAHYFQDQQEDLTVAGRVFFHLVENPEDDYPFAFMATYATRPSASRRAIHTPLKHALAEFQGEEKNLFSLITCVVRAARQSSLISDLLESGELFAALKFTPGEAYTFLKELPLYEESGIMCRVPDWWRKKRNGVKINIQVGQKEPARLGMDALINFVPELCLGDDPITLAELQAFLEMAEGLIRYKGKWVEVDRRKIESILAAFENVSKRFSTLSLSDALRLELNPEELLSDQDEEIELSVSSGQWLKGLTERLIHPERSEEECVPKDFQATLRAYQATGCRWLYQMDQCGFGACLADDMGLGKTVQVIGYLEYVRSKGKGPVLLVLPASLIGNWQNEIRKFAPAMPYQVLHKSEAKAGTSLVIEPDRFLYITTYGMALRLEELKERFWDCLILDEAQAIKNPGTKQTKALKAIPSRMRIAMTGTPIENRLGDLWSLFDFLNQGLLGSAKEFTDFSKSLTEEADGYARLRRMIQPFILRRLKTDKSIISDLPDKIEMNDYTTLSKRQIALYQQVVTDLTSKLDNAEGIERKGLVLSSIMKFKQICNHPDQYLGKDDYKPEHSGKFAQLKEICETIGEKRERVLVFTQFKEMTGPISEYLNGIFGKEGLVLHGGTPIKRRKEMVDEFNAEAYVPYMVLSLKAGGTGLNLTAASHVIHFDRWWNPAVENQATDRAFRIGQTKNVMVHKFVTQGTLEEKIDRMITDKQNLVQDLLGSGGEHWITEYSNEELLELFKLEEAAL